MNKNIPLARSRDWKLVVLLALLGIITRLMAIPASLWEWDDILFARALHRFNIAAHSPHPPGFPIYVFLTRIAYFITHDEHWALVTVGFSFGILLPPALFYFYQAIFNERSIAVAGALLGSFAPNVWVYSCAGRSDGPGLVLGIGALALMLYGRKSPRLLWCGCAVWGWGLGVRASLLPLVAPTLAVILAIWLRRHAWRVIIWAVIILACTVLSWYLPTVLHQGWRVYNEAVAYHRQYIWQTDSIFAANNSGILPHRLSRFFADIWGAEWIMHVMYSLAALGLTALAIKRYWQQLGWLAIAFVPYMIFAFVLNAPIGAALYALPYTILFTGLAACALIAIPSLMFKPEQRPRLAYLGLVMTVLITGALIGWAYPIIRTLHTQISPTLQAIGYLQANLDAQRDVLIYDGVFWPHVKHYLPGFRVIEHTERMAAVESLASSLNEPSNFVYLMEGSVTDLNARHFAWSPDKGAQRLSRLSLGRYFDIYVTQSPCACGVVFTSGWSNQEVIEDKAWRWMGRKGEVALLGATGIIKLHLKGLSKVAPDVTLPPTVKLLLNNQEVSRFTLTNKEFDQNIELMSDPVRPWSLLTIEIDQTAVANQSLPGGYDTRVLGLNCLLLECASVAR